MNKRVDDRADASAEATEHRHPDNHAENAPA
jgi:hypothetical protein